ncbi:MAG: hypothetical protein HQ536_04405 [Parcubacteria group bacterium]|nr:hypothetical protein [Parcubacteria group bacterium]
MNLLSPKFWLSLNPAPLSPTNEFVLLSIFAFLIVASIILRFVVFNKKFGVDFIKRIKSLRQMFLIMGIIGLTFLFFSYERAFVLGARFWFLLWMIAFLVWLGLILRDLLKKTPLEKEEKSKKEVLEKYLPKAKKKR